MTRDTTGEELSPGQAAVSHLTGPSLSGSVHPQLGMHPEGMGAFKCYPPSEAPPHTPGAGRLPVPVG